MKIQSLALCAGLLSLAMAPTLPAQSYTNQAQLGLAATGDTFTIGDKPFRLAPSAVVRKATRAPAANEVAVAGYLINPAPLGAPVPAARVRRSAADTPPAAGENLAAAVSEDGVTIVLMPQLNLYVDHIGVVDPIVRETGGTLVYSSAAGGKASIRYASVAEAMNARQRILGRAGVKAVSPARVPPRVYPQ